MSTTDTVDQTTEVDPLEGKRIQLIIDVDLEAEAANVVGVDGIDEEQARAATAKVASNLIAVRSELFNTLDEVVANGHNPVEATLGPDGYGLSFSIRSVYLTGQDVLTDAIEADRDRYADDPTAILEELFGADVVARAEEQARQILGDAGLLNEDE